MDQELIVKFRGDTQDWDRAVHKFETDLDRLGGEFGRVAPNIDRFEKKTTSAAVGLGSFLKSYLALDTAIRAGQMFLDATKEVQRYESILKVASKSQEDYAQNTAFLEGLSDKYNRNILDLGKSYAQLTIATRGTNLEGEKSDRLFAAVTATSSALQMSVDETNGTFQAFIQMVSKGNVQAEELRGQLGERLVGAFNLAAKAMGVTTEQLNDMLQKGEVTADELLPRLTIELEKAFGEDAQKNARNLGSSIEFAKGHLTQLLAEFGKQSGVTGFFDQAARDAGELASQLKILVEEYGALAGIGGLAEATKKTLLGDWVDTPLLDHAGMVQTRKQMSGYDIFQGEFKGNAKNFPFIKDKSTTQQQTPEQIEKAKKAAEKAAKEAARQLDAWTQEQIRIIKDETAQKLAESGYAIDAQYRTHNSDINTPGQVLPEGLKNAYSFNGGEMRKTGQVFTNELGSGASTLERMQAAIQSINDTANLDWAAKLDADNLTQQVNQMAISSEQLKEDVAKQLGEAFNEAARSIPQAIGMMIASLAMGGKGMQDVGNFFFQIAADLFQRVGEALLTASGLFKAAEIAIGTMQAPVALAGAVMAFAAAALLRSQINTAGQEASGRFFSGGIERRRVGVDNIPINVSAGEMILNSRQQRNMFALIDHGSQQRGISGGPVGRGEPDILVTKWSGDDLALVVQRGERKLRKFR